MDLTFGIAYSSEITKATDILEELLSAHPKTLDDPAPVVRVHELADSSVNLIARPWVHTADYWDVYWDLMREVKERFDAEGVTIPFPQRDLHIPGAIEVRLAGMHAKPSIPPGDPMADQPFGGTKHRATHEPGPAIADVGQPDGPAGQTDEESESG